MTNDFARCPSYVNADAVGPPGIPHLPAGDSKDTRLEETQPRL